MRRVRTITVKYDDVKMVVRICADTKPWVSRDFGFAPEDVRAMMRSITDKVMFALSETTHLHASLSEQKVK